MGEVFYRKYRARKFADLIGQDHVVSVLRQALVNKSPAHAYLFSGPRGTGKTSTARLLAKALNCSNFDKNKDVCDECENCIAVNHGNSMNVIEIDAASNRGINEIRQLREAVSYTNGAGYKVYIIDEVHMLTTEAFNALLKTLEEPPAHVVFVLATTELHKVPATILSRVQHFQFRLGTQDQIKKKLNHILKAEGYQTDDSVPELLFNLAEGGYRDAESLLGKLIDGLEDGNKIITEHDTYTILGLPAKQETSTLISYLLDDKIGQAMQLIDTLEQQGINWQYLIKMALSALKQDIISGLDKGESTQTQVDLLRSFASLYSQLKDLPSPKLALETEILLRVKTNEQGAAAAKMTEQQAQQPAQQVKVTEPLSVEKVSVVEHVPASQKNEPKTALKGASPAVEFNLDAYTSLLRREHITLPQILKAVKVTWNNGVLSIQPHTQQQLTMLKRSQVALEKVLKNTMGENAALNLVEKVGAAEHKSPKKLANIVERIREQEVSTAPSHNEHSAGNGSGAKDTSNAKLVEQLF